jgi:hypothetical protein
MAGYYIEYLYPPTAMEMQAVAIPLNLNEIFLMEEEGHPMAQLAQCKRERISQLATASSFSFESILSNHNAISIDLVVTVFCLINALFYEVILGVEATSITD